MEISRESVRRDPSNSNLTVPRSFGVWKVGPHGISKQYRFGNNPIRGLELEREFSEVTLVFLFSTRDEAKRCADTLNR